MMKTQNGLRKNLFTLVTLTLSFLVMYVFAYVFRIERTQFECGDDFFCAVNNSAVCMITEGRYVAYFYQFSAVVLSALKAPLNWILIAFSLQHVLFPHLVAICCLALKNTRNALLALIVPVSAIDATFFMYPYSELLYGFGFALLSDSRWRFRETKLLNRILWWFFVVATCASHPLAVVFLLVMMVARTVESSAKNMFRTIAPVLICFMVYSWWFNGESWLFVQEILVKDYQGPETLWSEEDLRGIYPMPFEVLVLFVTIGLMAYQNRWRRALLFLGVMAVEIVLIQLASSASALYRSLLVLTALLFLTDGIGIPSTRRLLVPIAALGMFGYYMNVTVEMSAPYTARKNLIQAIGEEVINLPGNRFICDRNPLTEDWFISSPTIWNEILMNTALRGNPKVVVTAQGIINASLTPFDTVYSNPVEKAMEMLSDCSTIDGRMFVCQEQLNRTYFDIGEKSEFIKYQPTLAMRKPGHGNSGE